MNIMVGITATIGGDFSKDFIVLKFNYDANYKINSRLDDIDALVQDVINQSNANSVEIQGTIIDVANQVGYNISSDLQTILDTNNGMHDMVAFYNENFTGLLTTTNMSINGVTDSLF